MTNHIPFYVADETSYTFERRPNSSDNTSNTRKIKKMIFAMLAAPTAIPVNPKTAATMAMIRNVIVQRNIAYDLNDE